MVVLRSCWITECPDEFELCNLCWLLTGCPTALRWEFIDTEFSMYCFRIVLMVSASIHSNLFSSRTMRIMLMMPKIVNHVSLDLTKDIMLSFILVFCSSSMTNSMSADYWVWVNLMRCFEVPMKTCSWGHDTNSQLWLFPATLSLPDLTCVLLLLLLLLLCL